MSHRGGDRHGGYAFGRFHLSADGALLLRDGVRVPLAPKVLRTLLVLVERAGEVVSKSDLLTAVWPDSFVEETGLTRNISVLRQALGDAAPAVIVTVARLGYRFEGPVARPGAPGEGLVTEEAPSARASGVAAAPLGADGTETRRLKRLLILPFRLLRDDPETGFLAFSVPDAVVTALSGLESLVVRSSAVAARLGGATPDPVVIADEANVDAVFTGTILRVGEQVRVNAQLLAVPCGTVLWSDALQVSLPDVFALQDRLVTHIVRSLSLSLTASDRHRLRSDLPASAAAYEYFLRANEAVGPQGNASSANLRVARDLYQRALEEDPRFAPAWARLGRCHYLIGKADKLDEPERACRRACREPTTASRRRWPSARI